MTATYLRILSNVAYYKGDWDESCALRAAADAIEAGDRERAAQAMAALYQEDDCP